jgi:hypothetical protein
LYWTPGTNLGKALSKFEREEADKGDVREEWMDEADEPPY